MIVSVRFLARVKKRIWIVYALFVLVFIYYCVKLVSIQILKGEELTREAYAHHLCNLPLYGERGKIVDRNGIILASSLPAYSVEIDKSEIQATDREKLQELSELVGRKDEVSSWFNIKDRYIIIACNVPDGILAKVKELSIPGVNINQKKGIELDKCRVSYFYKEQLQKLYKLLGKQSNISSLFTIEDRYVIIARKVSDEIIEKVKKLSIKGVYIIREDTGIRIYPYEPVMSDLIGRTDIDNIGLEGLEKSYDSILKEKSGYIKTECDIIGRGIPLAEKELVPPQEGDTLELTIDLEIQEITSKALKRALELHQAEEATGIVIEPDTGEILAMATVSKKNEHRVRNASICEVYEPGSTFKVILAAAALDMGVAKIKDKFDCGNSVQVGGWTIHNADDNLFANPQETLEDILVYSFNTGAVRIANRIGKKKAYEYITNFGFSKCTGVDFPGELGGLLSPLEEWSSVTSATVSFGQGIAVTPLQMAIAFSAIVNGGKLIKPHFAKRILNGKGEVVKEFLPHCIKQVIKPSTSKQLREILAQVVERGTGKRAAIEGVEVGGKTGTAQVADPSGGYSGEAYIASFIGFFPVDRPKYLILIKVDKPRGIKWGGYVAAPVFKEIGEQIYSLKGL